MTKIRLRKKTLKVLNKIYAKEDMLKPKLGEVATPGNIKGLTDRSFICIRKP